MEENKSKVYIKTDEKNRILRCEGGYTMSNIDNVEDWIFVDEGTGDKYNLCQSHYFDKPLYEEHGIPQYKYYRKKCVERSAEEIQKDIEDLPKPEESTEDLLLEMAADHEERICLIELGIA